MASNVFGNPITNATLEGMPEYQGKTITRKDRAHVALNMKNAQEKDRNARQYVENLKARWGTGVSTLCVVYNSTGDALTFITAHDWHGHIGPATYPVRIENGQWGGFLHVKTSGAATGSSAAAVYRGKNDAGADCDWMLSWSTPWDRNLYNNKAYTEVRDAHHYDEGNNRWGVVSDKLNDSDLYDTSKWKGCYSTVTIGSDTSPIFEGIMMLESDA
ncbi:hypothetical protein KSP39_PZI019053 [Platanthera zijinensis]|uniref:23 kDa jasmonate-induced protein-like n=1 Tax=Platanthera zijinensis TaxID=2320716 RepID=A0AAP0B0W2_9ASPA